MTSRSARPRGARRAIALAAALMVLAASCTGDSTDDAPAPSRGPVGGTLRLGMSTASYWGLDPRDEWNAATWELFRCCLLRTMMSYDVTADTTDLRPIPDLAAEPPEISADGRTWTFRIREGVMYAPPLDDVEVTSGDFVRAITRAAASYDPTFGGLPGYMSMIDGFTEYVDDEANAIVGLQTPDPYTLRVTTTDLDATLLYLFALPVTAPIPPQPGDPSAEFGVATGFETRPRPDGNPDSYGGVLASTGPYMYEGAEDIDHSQPPKGRTPASGFTAWDIHLFPEGGDRVDGWGAITLVRNPSWRPEDDPLRAALADRIEVVGAPPEELFPRMESGRIDLVFDTDPPPEVIERYQADPELRPLLQTPIGSPGLVFASFNVALPPFDDVAVRKAVAYAMDRLGLAELYAGPGTRVAQHFALDTFEASLLASWSGIPGEGGHGDPSAARREMSASRYTRGGDRCEDPVCEGVVIVIRDLMEPGLDEFREALLDLGITPRFEVHDSPYDCLDPEAKVAMCVGMGWAPDFPSAAQYLWTFFARDGALPTTRLGATPAELRRWGYDVTDVPSLESRIDRCEHELGAGQAPCWARLDQYVVTQLMPAVPMGFFGSLKVSTPALGPFPWDPILLVPALDRIAAPARVD